MQQLHCCKVRWPASHGGAGRVQLLHPGASCALVAQVTPSQEGPGPPCAGASAERRHDRKLQRKLLRLDSRWFYFDPCPVNSCGLLGGCCRRCLGYCHSSSRGRVGRPGRFDTAIGIRTVPAAMQRLNPLRSASVMTVTSGFSAICAVLKPRSQQRESNPG